MIEVKVNDKAVTATLDRLLKFAGDLRPALTDIGEYLVMSTKQCFAAQRDPDGNPLGAQPARHHRPQGP